MTARKSSVRVEDVSLPDDGPAYVEREALDGVVANPNIANPEDLPTMALDALPAEPADPNIPVAMVGHHQLRVMSALLNQHGIRTDTAVYDWLTLRLGREVTSRKDITAVEAAHILADLDDAPLPAGIYDALAAVMRDVDHVAKGDRNTQQNFSFRGVDAVVNAAGPAFRTHRVIVLPVLRNVVYEAMPLASGKTATVCRVIVAYQFVASDGSSVEAVVAAEAFDMGDKATPKAMSVAFRTALLQALALPTDEPDPDAQTYEAQYDMRHQNAPGDNRDERGPGGANPAPGPDDLTGLDTQALLLVLDELFREAGKTFEEGTAVWRGQLGGVDVSYLDTMDPEPVAAYVRRVREFLATQGVTS